MKKGEIEFSANYEKFIQTVVAKTDCEYMLINTGLLEK